MWCLGKICVTGRHRFSATFFRWPNGIFGRKMNLLPQIFKVLLKIYRESIKKQERPLKTKLKADLPDVTTSNKIHKKQSTTEQWTEGHGKRVFLFICEQCLSWEKAKEGNSWLESNKKAVALTLSSGNVVRFSVLNSQIIIPALSVLIKIWREEFFKILKEDFLQATFNNICTSQLPTPRFTSLNENTLHTKWMCSFTARNRST